MNILTYALDNAPHRTLEDLPVIGGVKNVDVADLARDDPRLPREDDLFLPRGRVFHRSDWSGGGGHIRHRRIMAGTLRCELAHDNARVLGNVA